jgi:hypothetical protein
MVVGDFETKFWAITPTASRPAKAITIGKANFFTLFPFLTRYFASETDWLIVSHEIAVQGVRVEGIGRVGLGEGVKIGVKLGVGLGVKVGTGVGVKVEVGVKVGVGLGVLVGLEVYVGAGWTGCS